MCSSDLCNDEQDELWVTYKYSIAHPILRWLPSKLAQFIADNYAAELDIPDVEPGRPLSVAAKNTVLKRNIVHGSDRCALRTYTEIQWESDLGIGRPKARCFPFKLHGHKFRGKNPQVTYIKYIVYYIVYYIAHYV